MRNEQFNIEWIDRQRESQCAPDPAYPTGKEIKLFVDGMPHCKAELPYPAKRCGVYIVECTRCGLSVGVTTAGRPDDPKSIELSCKEKFNA